MWLSMSEYRCDGELMYGGARLATGYSCDALAQHAWPPLPDENYRRSHYVVSDWLDKVGGLDITASYLELAFLIFLVFGRGRIHTIICQVNLGLLRMRRVSWSAWTCWKRSSSE